MRILSYDNGAAGGSQGTISGAAMENSQSTPKLDTPMPMKRMMNGARFTQVKNERKKSLRHRGRLPLAAMENSEIDAQDDDGIPSCSSQSIHVA